MSTASILEGWTVQNMMRRDVVTAYEGMTVAALARLLDEHQISGVPVVNAEDRVVGVVSHTDIVREVSRQPARSGSSDPAVSNGDADAEAEVGEVTVSSFFHRTNGDVYPGLSAMAILPTDAAGAKHVSEIMMPARFSVRPTTSLAGLARYLVNAHVHRALVMEDDALLGIVTTFDVLHAIAESEVDESAGGAESDAL